MVTTQRRTTHIRKITMGVLKKSFTLKKKKYSSIKTHLLKIERQLSFSTRVDLPFITGDRIYHSESHPEAIRSLGGKKFKLQVRIGLGAY